MKKDEEPSIPPPDSGTEQDGTRPGTPPAEAESVGNGSTPPEPAPDVNQGELFDLTPIDPALAAVGNGRKTSADELKDPQEDNAEGGGHFIEHLDEIRTRLIRSALVLALATGLSALYSDFLVDNVLIGPLKRSSGTLQLQNLVPYGQISIYLQAVFFSGFIVSFPFLALQLWQFVAPGLHEHERSAGRFSILFISLSFFLGIMFGYFVFLPVSLAFFASFGSPLIENNISVQDYASFFIGTLLTAGLVFELPFISYILSKIGLLTPAFMRFYRRHAIVTLLIVAALVTPSTDIVTQLVIGVPLILLYEASILISAHVNRNNAALKRS
ncbi:MAG: preprotein translocase subunit TatC [Pelodictyon luteolum]|uniref:Sec-independent protein translocase protein TatC n=2 Tax=Pelodictyon luteolum TaxID=1100 RepID=Q3B3J9_CHLL3|nr:twin-arginine translocase subunit TatC [Pelodictyon luteolum]ABB24082.1 Sec-independent protein translocase TatC [Pelodictyon luteolum DSM 273]KZK75297.1 MAG: preprotein translocase subunit TatC [Pelodictyon luteolum]